MAAGPFGLEVMVADDLALLRQAQAAFDGVSRLGQDGAVGGPAAAAHGAAAAMEEAQAHISDDRTGLQGALGLVKVPARGHVAAVLVAVAVAQHDFLAAAAQAQVVAVGGAVVELGHDIRARPANRPGSRRGAPGPAC